MTKEKLKKADFLLEIGTEELPAKILRDLITELVFAIERNLQSVELSYASTSFYVSPRRLSVLVHELSYKQKDRILEKRGPSLSASFDDEGRPTQACLSFANACGVTLADLVKYKTSAGAWVLYRKPQAGANVLQLMPKIVEDSVKELHFAKPMRWGDKNISFIRPIRWVVMLYGKDLIPAEIFGLKTQRETYGHRFYHPEAIDILSANQYVSLLFEQGRVMVDFEERREAILQRLSLLAKPIGTLVVDDDLLNETSGLVEWPSAIMGKFDPDFLTMPIEALAAVIKNKQRCFSLVNSEGKLLPYFIAVTNIESKNPAHVIKDYERIMHARLSDIKFFYNVDLKQPLEAYVERLKYVVYQTELGTLYDKVNRMEKLAFVIAQKINADPNAAQRAAFLAKADLTTEMVKELPELQGIMSYYYALHQKEPEQIALAIKEHYLPRFSGDALPTSKVACAVSLADRLDHLIGAFGINQAPTAEKDPLGLRRAALAVIRIIIEKELSLDLKELLEIAKNNYQNKFKNVLVEQVLDFIFERLRSWYLEKGVTTNVFNAVLARTNNSLLDFNAKIEAIQNFLTLPQAASLIAAYKRISNILKKTPMTSKGKFNASLLMEDAERELVNELNEAEKIIQPLYAEGFYTEALKILSELKTSIDNFFDKVMVAVEDEKLRNNRLALLTKLINAFSFIADISLL